MNSLDLPPISPLQKKKNTFFSLSGEVAQQLRLGALNLSHFGSNLCSATYELCDFGQAA